MRRNPSAAQRQIVRAGRDFYVENHEADPTSPFAFFVTEGARMLIPGKGDYGFDWWNNMQNGLKAHERKELKRFLAGEGYGSKKGGNDTLVREWLEWRLGRMPTAEEEMNAPSFEEFMDAVMAGEADYQAWKRTGKFDTRADREAREMEEYDEPQRHREQRDLDTIAAQQDADRREMERMGDFESERPSRESDYYWNNTDFSRRLRFSRAMVNGRETAVAEGYPLSIREARDPDKVLKVLSPIVGKSAAQLGEMKLTRINAESMEHTLNSKEAIHDRKDSSRKGKRLWRGRIGGLSVLDDLIATSPLGNQEAPNHFNKEWKKGAKFYRADTRFAIETEQGYEIYPCKLLVAELKNGERFVYDLVDIKEPTLSASAGSANLALPQGRTGESASSQQSIPQTGVSAQGENLRMSRSGIYTGAAADYANRSRQGGKDDGPSLLKVGTGEGSQVYGWGLYGSTVRGVAEGYAVPNHLTPEGLAASTLRQYEGKRSDAIKRLQGYVESGALSYRKLRQDEIERAQKAIQILKDHKEASSHLYEQTFFTDRAPGDESHLLKWYEPVSVEQKEWILDQGVKEGRITGFDPVEERDALRRFVFTKDETGGEVYEWAERIFGSPKAASEFLARAGIDGVKYPVDSYGGKGVKDGDEAGWNYVSFRDDNIRVDHKWTDGQQRYSRRLFEFGNTNVGMAPETAVGETTLGARAANRQRMAEERDPGRALWEVPWELSPNGPGGAPIQKPLALGVAETVRLVEALTGKSPTSFRRTKTGKNAEDSWASKGRIGIAKDMLRVLDEGDAAKIREYLCGDTSRSGLRNIE